VDVEEISVIFAIDIVGSFRAARRAPGGRQRRQALGCLRRSQDGRRDTG
jgi:hypothetical protein